MERFAVFPLTGDTPESPALLLAATVLGASAAKAVFLIAAVQEAIIVGVVPAKVVALSCETTGRHTNVRYW